MPELPEVETIRRQLTDRIVGQTITAARIYDAKFVEPEDAAAVVDRIVGRRIERIGRRGKYLLIHLDSGDVLMLHLRMTGRLHLAHPGTIPSDPYRRARFRFDNLMVMDYSDLRRFGRAWVVPASEVDDAYWEGRVGVEPLEPGFTDDVLASLVAGRRTPIKAFLLDQRRVAGIGNIYADEALFQAGIHPERPTGTLTAEEISRLRTAIVDRLEVGIVSGGASIDRYRDTLGRTGTMQDMLRVHLHEDDPCPVCGTVIEKTRVAQRGTYHCPRCQPAV